MRISDWSSDVCSSDLSAATCKGTSRERTGGSMADSRTAPDAAQTGAATGGDMVEELPYRSLSGAAVLASCLLTLLAIVIVINQLLNLQLLAGVVFVENRYLFLLATTILPVVFLAYPLRSQTAPSPPPFYHRAPALLTFDRT